MICRLLDSLDLKEVARHKARWGNGRGRRNAWYTNKRVAVTVNSQSGEVHVTHPAHHRAPRHRRVAWLTLTAITNVTNEGASSRHKSQGTKTQWPENRSNFYSSCRGTGKEAEEESRYPPNCIRLLQHIRSGNCEYNLNMSPVSIAETAIDRIVLQNGILCC